MDTRSRILSESLGGVVYMRGPRCYQAMSKRIIVKSMVGIILCQNNIVRIEFCTQIIRLSGLKQV